MNFCGKKVSGKKVMENLTEFLDDLTALSLRVLELSGKTLVNGYKITSQKHIIRGIADVTVEVLRGR